MSKNINGSTRGVFIISITPFTDSGEIDWKSTDSLIEFYLEKGVTGITILGIMGEAQKLTDQESADFAKYVIKRVKGRVPIIVGVSNPGTDHLVRLSRISMEAGAAGVMIAPITGLKHEVQIRDYFAEVFQRLGEDIPVCYQDYPQTTGVNISVPNFLQLVDSHANLVMFKHEEWPGLRKLQSLRNACNGEGRRRISILAGNGALHLPQEMQRGSDGAMTGFAYPEMLVQVVNAYFADHAEEAENIYDSYLPLVRHEQQIGLGLALRKEVLRRRGAIASAAVRAPGPKVDLEDLQELNRLIRRLELRLAMMDQRQPVTLI